MEKGSPFPAYTPTRYSLASVAGIHLGGCRHTQCSVCCGLRVSTLWWYRDMISGHCNLRVGPTLKCDLFQASDTLQSSLFMMLETLATVTRNHRVTKGKQPRLCHMPCFWAVVSSRSGMLHALDMWSFSVYSWFYQKRNMITEESGLLEEWNPKWGRVLLHTHLP